MNSYYYSVYYDGDVVSVLASTRSKARYQGYLKMQKEFYLEVPFSKFIKGSGVYKRTEHADYGSDSFDRDEYRERNMSWRARPYLL